MKIMMFGPNKIHSRRFISMLLNLGHKVIYIDSKNPIPQGLPNYQFVPYPRWFFWLIPKINNRLIAYLLVLRLRMIWQGIKPDIVHVHWIGEIAYLCAKGDLNPLVLTSWGSDINNLFDTDKFTDAYRLRISYALSRADYVTADTIELLERCELLAGEKLSASLFYYGIDLEKFRPDVPASKLIMLREKLGIPANTKVILSIRRLIPMMGHHHILRAFALAVAKTEQDMILVFHRYSINNGDYENELNILAKELGVAQRIVWVEDIIEDEQMPVFYSLADLVINYPDFDGFPVSLFEAAACKRMIITSDLKSYHEVFVQGAFVVVSKGDVNGLSNAIIKAIHIPKEQLEQQLRKNYELIMNIADQKQCIRGMEHIYLELTTMKQTDDS